MDKSDGESFFVRSQNSNFFPPVEDSVYFRNNKPGKLFCLKLNNCRGFPKLGLLNCVPFCALFPRVTVWGKK